MDVHTHLRGLPPIRVVYTDLDGTLLGRGGALLRAADGSPSLRAAAALVDAARGGLAVVPVSGRRAGQLADDARLLGLRDAIAEVGTVILRDGTRRYEWGDCPPDLGATPRDALANAGAHAALLAAFSGDLRPYRPWDDGREGGFLLHGRVDAAAAEEVLATAGCGWARLVDNGPAGGWPGRGEVRAYHLVPRGTGKGPAVADDLRWRGLPAAAAVAVGDSVEDAAMASVVGTYVAVAGGTVAAGGNAFRATGAQGDGFAEVVAAVLAARR